MSKLDTYRAATAPVPAKMLKWQLYGSGLDKLLIAEVDVPACGPEELLVRQDACGLCFSDTKVIGLGPEHPRLKGRNMQREPVTLGHEVAVTVVQVGESIRDRFRVGDRFIVQADVFYEGVSMAYGYVLSGGLAEYSIIPKQMIFGDEGCYLLPLQPDAGYAETALVEPWACVVAAYNQSHRAGLKPGGNLLVIAEQPAPWADWTGAYPEGEGPAVVYVLGTGEAAAKSLPKAMIDHPKSCVLDEVANWPDLFAYTGGHGFDDIVVLGAASPETVEGAATALALHGIMNLVGDASFPRKLSIDIGRIHYNWHHYVGAASAVVADGYPETRGADLEPGGVAWFIGAGGPMGQMHVQRAVQHPNPPRCIVATDIDAERLQSVVDRYGADAAERGVELVAMNPKTMAPEAFNAELNRLCGGKGFTDIVSLVPVPFLIEHAADFLAQGAWFNVFAGVARGTMANLDLDAIRARGARYVGSSGSAISDMRQTLGKVETHELSTNASLAAIGGMRAACEGMAAVKDGRFPGKTLVFPLIHDLPLMPLAELEQAYPTVFALLKDGKFWTNAAEEELLRLTIARDG